VYINIERYKITTCGSTEIFIKQLNDYITYRKYNCDVCDIMPYIISNALSLYIIIVECRNGVLNYHKIGENNLYRDMCVIYKDNDHYDSIVIRKETICDKPELDVHIKNSLEENTNTFLRKTYTNSEDNINIVPCEEAIHDKYNLNVKVTNAVDKKKSFAKGKKNKKCNCNIDKLHMCLCKMKSKFKKHNGLNIAHINCRSLLPKLDEISYIMNSANVNVLCLTETWLDDTVCDSDIFIDGYTLFRNDRGGRGGGVAIYVQNNVKFLDRSITLQNEIEAVFVEVETQSNDPNILLSCIYRPPNSSPEIYDSIVDYI
jgi:hypothetical protein